VRATAAAAHSVDASRTPSIDALLSSLADARRGQPEGWLRAVGYDVAAAGAIDRNVLDRAGSGPIRVQDRTATWWVLSSDGLDRVLPADALEWPDGVQVDGAGRPTGVLVRLDGWLRTRIGAAVEDLASVGRALAGWGVTAIEDASVTNGPDDVTGLAGAGLPQRVSVMTGGLDGSFGPVKVVLDDADLPDLETFAASIGAAHSARRPVAIHCVTAVQLLLSLAALELAGSRPGDRIEHASSVPADAIGALWRLGVRVVTQPGLVWSRGDRYLDEVPEDEHDSLYRIATLRRARIRVLGSTDAPFGPSDPWVGIRAATDRRTSSGRVVAPAEAVGPRTAVELFTGIRALRPGMPADICMLDATWGEITRSPQVLATLVGGRQIFGSPLTDAIDETPVEGGRGVDGLAGQRQPGAPLAADPPGDADGAAGAGDQTHRHLGQ
jgi:predicted amidohydrolase YtcJ